MNEKEVKVFYLWFYRALEKLHHSWSGEREIGLAKELFIRDREFAFFCNNGSWKEQRRQRLPLCEVRVHYTTHVDMLR
jgi:hypothetical protein